MSSPYYARLRPSLPLLLLVLASSCTADVEGVAILADASEIIIKKPPINKTVTSPGCGSVTNLGECKDGVATTCDVERDTLETEDCSALSQDCVIDKHHGASCRSLSPPQAPNPSTSCPGDKVDTNGYCDGDTAIWCSEDRAAVNTWDCSQEGKECKVDDCKTGAYCCGSGTEPESCGDLTFDGVCTDDNKAKWCDTDENEIFTLDCTAQGDECLMDVCAPGAYCCTKAFTEDCGDVTTEGECDGNTLRYCTTEGGLVEEECDSTKICQVDTCRSGMAWCCSVSGL